MRIDAPPHLHSRLTPAARLLNLKITLTLRAGSGRLSFAAGWITMRF
jgi:hypothetical protein